MQLYFYPLIGIFLGVLFLRVLFDIVVLSRRLRISIGSRLIGVTFLSNAIVLFLLAIVAMPLMNYSWVLFMIQLLLVAGIEAPIYQIFFRTKSWYNIVLSLLIARFLFALFSTGFSILLLYLLQDAFF